MADRPASFAQARAQLEDLVAQVRRKDVPLEKCLDLLEEGVRLANECTELSDRTEWSTLADESADPDGAAETDSTGAEASQDAPGPAGTVAGSSPVPDLGDAGAVRADAGDAGPTECPTDEDAPPVVSGVADDACKPPSTAE